ncbi:MAG: family 1 glycosylhydrolase, partial [Bacteroidia bacterium]|nr:family 1 glycosylhydrolase [Bacteroidia bacterium]
MKKSDFGNDFVWGVATAAYQIEGAWNADGKGESIWDRFTHSYNNIERCETGDLACDHYHKYPEDIALMKQLNIQASRFSIAWTRIFPYGEGKTNPLGVAHYHKVIDTYLEAGIQP